MHSNSATILFFLLTPGTTPELGMFWLLIITCDWTMGCPCWGGTVAELGMFSSLYPQYPQLLFSIGAPHTGHFAAIIDSSPCLKIDKSSRWDNKCKIVPFCKRCKSLYKLIISCSSKIFHTVLAKSPTNQRTKNWSCFLYRKVRFCFLWKAG